MQYLQFTRCVLHFNNKATRANSSLKIVSRKLYNMCVFICFVFKQKKKGLRTKFELVRY